MSKFRELLTIENTRPYLRDMLMKEKDQGDGWLDALHGPIRDATAAHLKEMRDLGTLKPIAGTTGHDIRAVEKWDCIRTNEFPQRYSADMIEEDILNFAEELVGSSRSPMWEYYVKAMHDPYQTEETAFDALISALEAGNCHYSDPSDRKCNVDGERYSIIFEGWVPRAVELRSKVPIKPILPEEGLQAVHAEVDFTTGDLLITDTISIPEFEEVIQLDHATESMTDFGRAERTQKIAAQGIAHVFHPYGPKIMPMENGGLNFVQFEDPEDEREHLLDSPDSDLWAVSVVDKETLAELIEDTRGCTRTEALGVIAAAMEDRPGIIERKVEPGTYNLYFGMNDEVNLNEYDIEGIDQDGLREIMVLSPEPLQLTPKPGSKLEDTMSAGGPKL